MMRIVAWICLASQVALGGTLLADKAEQYFRRLDRDSDGKISLTEFKGSLQGKQAECAEARFKQLDQNNDGNLNLSEYKAGVRRRD